MTSNKNGDARTRGRTSSTGRRAARSHAETTRQRRRSETHRAGDPATGRDQAGAVAGEPTVDSLELFFREVRRHPLLTAEEEIELAKRIERGDLEAKERMINANLRLVIAQARRFQGLGLPLGDLIQEGMLGLIRAVEKFDWRKGFKFSTYGTLWIQQAIQRGLQNSGRTIRVPVHVGQRERKVRKIEQQLELELGREPTDAEIAVAAKLTVEQVEEARSLASQLASLDQSVGEDGQASLADLMASERPQPEDEVASALGDQRVREVVERLPGPQRNVVRIRFGLAGDEPRSLRETGERLGLSAEGTRQIEQQALRRLAASGELDELRPAA